MLVLVLDHPRACGAAQTVPHRTGGLTGRPPFVRSDLITVDVVSLRGGWIPVSAGVGCNLLIVFDFRFRTGWDGH